jgi:hypothetical protein
MREQQRYNGRVRREVVWTACFSVWLIMLLSAAWLGGFALGRGPQPVPASQLWANQAPPGIESNPFLVHRPGLTRGRFLRIIDRPTVPYSVTVTPDDELDPSARSWLLRVAAVIEAFFARAARAPSFPGQSPEFDPRPVPNQPGWYVVWGPRGNFLCSDKGECQPYAGH